MTRNVRQIGFLACFLLVLLRVSIGWQFLYEGIWKLNTEKTSRPWSAEGYLSNARGPLRDEFRSLVDDPDGLDRLDFNAVVSSWEKWRDRFVQHYSDVPGLDEKLNILLDGPAQFTQKLEKLPDGVDLKKFSPKKFKAPDAYVRYDSGKKLLETNLHLLPEERDALLAMGKGKSDKKYQDAVKKLAASSDKLSLKERLQVLLREDPDRVGQVREEETGTIDHERPGKKQVYEHLLARYDANLKNAREAFQQEHLEKQWREIQEKKAELVGPVDALTAEFHADAYKLLENSVKDTAEMNAELKKGPVPQAESKVRQINQITMWSLTILGVTLILGLFSRLSALGAAGLLLLFYLPMPPWPGVPEAPGPEHSLFVNKNLIECIACLALASLPTGRWIGIDALLRRFVLRKKTD